MPPRSRCRLSGLVVGASSFPFVSLGTTPMLKQITLVHSGGVYKLVKLASGAHSVHSLLHGETFHPVIGPVAEAEALYVRQLQLIDRLQRTADQFVIWDVGLGAAANVLA